MTFTVIRLKVVVLVIAGAAVAVSAAIGNSAGATGNAAADVVATYKAKCASCHAADGSGATAAGKSLKVRDLRSADVQKQSDAELYALIAKGKAKMPGYEKILGADKCKELVAYTRRLGGK